MPEAAADRRGNEMRPIRIQKAEKNKKKGTKRQVNPSNM